MGILMAGNYANVFMDLFEASLLNNFYKINCRETRNMGAFYRWDIFYLDKRWGLVQKKIWVLPEIKCKKDYEGRSWNLKYHNLPKLTDFLDVCITLSQQTLCTTQWRKYFYRKYKTTKLKRQWWLQPDIQQWNINPKYFEKNIIYKLKMKPISKQYPQSNQ